MSVLDIRLTEAKVNDLLGFKRKTVSGQKCSVTRQDAIGSFVQHRYFMRDKTK